MTKKRTPPPSSSPIHGVIGFAGDYYRLLFENAGVPMVGTDENLLIRSWNLSATRMFGAGETKMVGIPLNQIIPEEGRQEADRALHAALEKGTTSQFEFEHKESSSSSKQLAVTVSPIPNRSGKRIGALACFRDITNRIHMADELGRHRKMVSLGQMAGALSHHFNNILGGIVTSVDYALEANDPNVRLRVLQKTAHALNRATGLVDSLLAFAEGDYKSVETADISQVVTQFANRIDSQLQAENITLQTEIHPVVTRLVPRKQFDTVLYHLVRNATDAMPLGGTVTLSLDECNNWLYVRISDTGCGMNEEDLDRIFEPFFSKSTAEGGLHSRHQGLGLAVVHGIIKTLSGRIQVFSKPGAGTTIEIRIPSASSHQEG